MYVDNWKVNRDELVGERGFELEALSRREPAAEIPRDPIEQEKLKVNWSGREDLNLRPPGPEPETDVLSRCPV
jgi:hypothetical protein